MNKTRLAFLPPFCFTVGQIPSSIPIATQRCGIIVFFLLPPVTTGLLENYDIKDKKFFFLLMRFML